MKIACFILTYNEEKILPHTLQHYKSFCDGVYILDNCSIDDTLNIAKSFDVEVISWSNDTIDENKYISIKNNCYKPYMNEYDYFIVCDCDEFLYHKNIKEYIENTQYDIYKCVGYEMVYANFDYKAQQYKDVVYGSKRASFDKCLLFKSGIEINYSIGAHNINNSFTQSELELRHMKYLNLDYVEKRYNELCNRLSDTNKSNGWAFHYNWKREEIQNYYNELCKDKEQIKW